MPRHFVVTILEECALSRTLLGMFDMAQQLGVIQRVEIEAKYYKASALEARVVEAMVGMQGKEE